MRINFEIGKMKPELEGGFIAFAIFLLIGTIFSSSFVLGATYSSKSAVSVKYQSSPTFQANYGDKVNTYWPILAEKGDCTAREDFMLQVAPFGCQPAVVRSDLLAEQDVPVFCQINSVDINPLIKVERIKNIDFTVLEGSQEISGVGFHPARAALRSQNGLLGSPLVNNIGYAVVVLKRQPEEAKLPESVNVTLQARISYEADNAYGIGKSEFILEPASANDWESEKLKNSFWNGRYFVRLEEADENFADVSIYEGDKKMVTTRVKKGETSREFYVPGLYCRAGLSVAYDSYMAAQRKARIEVSSGSSYDAFDVYEGSNFHDGRCSVRKIEVNSDGESGRVIGSCAGKQFVIELKTKSNQSSSESIFINGKSYPVERLGNKYWIDLKNYSESIIKGRYFFEAGNLTKEEGNQIVVYSNGSFGSSVKKEQQTFYQTLHALVKDLADKEGVVGEAPGPLSEYYNDAIESYERVADDYSSEGEGIYGKEALQKAINLAREMGDEKTLARLINRFVGLYPGEAQSEVYKDELERTRNFDSSLAGEAVEFDNTVKVLRLVSLSAPAKKSFADMTIQGKSVRLALESTKEIKEANKNLGTIKLEKLDVDKAEIGVYCNTGKEGELKKESHLLKITDTSKKVCKDTIEIRLDDTEVEKAVKIRLIPTSKGSRSETNLSVFVGIEKRAIQLTPDKVAEKIEKLNETIRKWQKIADTLGKVVSGLKGACFATAALLTFKNFMTGLSGEAIARQEVMNGENGWKERCKALVPNPYPTMDACYIAKSSEIDSEVAKTTAAMNKVNAKIQAIQNKHVASTDLFGKSVDTEKVRAELAEQIKADYPGEKINMGDKKWVNANGKEHDEVAIEELLSKENVDNGSVSTEAMRSLMLNVELKKNGGLNEGQAKNVDDKLVDFASRTNENMVVNWEFQRNKANTNYPAAFEAASQNSQTRYAGVKPLTEQLRTETGFSDPSITHLAVVRVNPGMSKKGEQSKSFKSGMYNLGLEGDPRVGTYSIKEVTKQGEPGTKIDPSEFSDVYGLGNIKSIDGTSYQNEIQRSDRYVRYYENEPYKGMPAIVPFDTRAGWYAATQQTLPAFGGIGAFDASGRVTSFWVCNVGENGKIQFDQGFGDDLCQQVNLNTGQPLNAFPGLDSSKASSIIAKGQQAINEAARQYGNKYSTINGERFEVGTPMTGTPSTQCQDFMSPKDCHLMFNVCDPVVCPPSRCNFGGTYYVANVAQTGIIGSIFLCLPNIREGILIPVCLTGIHAGIEGWISIMKNYRDCLQESLENGRMVGICDQIYSIYLCEFFWNQVAPFVNVLIPKLIEMAYGQGVRGGAEYLSVQSAWQNMQGSIDYFTQSYAANSFEAFRARGVQEIGSEVCKSFISVKSPTSFDTLLEPDSPPQFHAWFDEKTFTTATVPATSQYKVFYHIFAGNDQGVHYNVYLRDPPTSGYYAANPTVSVASGFIAKGEYASQSRDFTAPTGYKELCVRINNDEECGFKQVSSSFAVNYLRDSYIKSEASKVTITSQKECISGGNNPMALINPNVQQGAEELISPEIYNRGIVRICASDNPGSKTDPSRYVDTGYCDNPKIRCWIDKRSVEQAITQGNVGVLNDTLEVLDARTKALLDAQNATLGDSEVESRLMALRNKVVALSEKGSESEAKTIIGEASELLNGGKLFWNRHKAQVLIILGDAQGHLAKYYKGVADGLKPDVVVSDVLGTSGEELDKIFEGNRPSYDGMYKVYQVIYSTGTTDDKIEAYGINEKNELVEWSTAEQKWVVVGENSASSNVKRNADWLAKFKAALIKYVGENQSSDAESKDDSEESGEGEQETKKEIKIIEINLPDATPLYYQFDKEWYWSDNRQDWYRTDAVKTSSGQSPVKNNLLIIQSLRGKDEAKGKQILDDARLGIIGNTDLCEEAYKGAFDWTDEKECLKQGNCFFVDRGLIDECHSCKDIKSCSDYVSYSDKLTVLNYELEQSFPKDSCLKNYCKVNGGCKYDDEKRLCLDAVDVGNNGGNTDDGSNAGSGGEVGEVANTDNGAGSGGNGGGQAPFTLDKLDIRLDPGGVYYFEHDSKIFALSKLNELNATRLLLPADLNDNYQDSVKYLDIWKKLCEYKEAQKVGSCEWDSESSRAKLPMDERFIFEPMDSTKLYVLKYKEYFQEDYQNVKNGSKDIYISYDTTIIRDSSNFIIGNIEPKMTAPLNKSITITAGKEIVVKGNVNLGKLDGAKIVSEDKKYKIKDVKVDLNGPGNTVI